MSRSIEVREVLPKERYLLLSAVVQEHDTEHLLMRVLLAHIVVDQVW